jgi:hypothetical protein
VGGVAARVRHPPPQPAGRRRLASTRTFGALAYAFAVSGDDEPLIAMVDELFAGLAQPGTPSAAYLLLHRDGAYDLSCDGRPLVSTRDEQHALSMLAWHINQEAIARSSALVRLHAAAACRQGAAVLMPGPPGAGKSTLVAGLVRAGLDYLGDELVALDPASGDVLGFPKPLSLDARSQQLVGGREPPHALAPAARERREWQLPVAVLRADAVSRRARPRFIVFPDLGHAGAAVLTGVRKADATVRLARCTFGFEHGAARDLPALARAVESADCYALRAGSLATACKLVLDLYAAHDSSHSTD